MDYKHWTDLEIAFLSDNYGIMPVDEIAERLGRQSNSVAHKASRLGLKRPERWTDDELQYLKAHYSDQTNQEIAGVIGRSKTAVDLKINKLGLVKSPYVYNHAFFRDIDTQDKAYWLGFFYADGCVHISHTGGSVSYEACIKLQGGDGGHLKKFNRCINGNVPVNYHERISAFSGLPENCAEIRLYSREIVEDLIRHGCVQNKSFIIRFPDLREDLVQHFIRGFFDGDGCFCRDSKARNTCAVNFCSASRDFLTSLRTTIYAVGITSYIVDEGAKHTFRLYIKGMENCDKMLAYMYNDANVYLDRKYTKALRFYEENQIAQRLLHRSVTSGFYFLSDRETGEAEMPIRMEGCV